MTSTSVYFGVMKVPFVDDETTRDECLKGFEATMGKFYRQPPGYIHYQFAACRQEPNCLLGFHVWSSKELFDSLPLNSEDEEKLSKCRQPFMEKIAGPPAAFLTQHSVGDSSKLPAPLDPSMAPPSFDAIMGQHFQPELDKVERNK